MLVARVARADDVDRDVAMAPGTFGDPLHALELSPSFLLVPVDDVPAGLAIRDADPSRVKIFVDGFEVPNTLRGGRSVFFGDGVSQLRRFDDGMDFAYGGATGGGLEITTISPTSRWASVAATPQDASVILGARDGYVGGLRLGFLAPARAHRLDLDWNDHVDLQVRIDWRLSRRWRLAFSGIGTLGDGSFARDTLTASYRNAATSAILAVSAMELGFPGTTTSFDTRADLRHTMAHVAGLDALELRAGESSSVTFGDTTRFDGGAWTAVGLLAKQFVAIGGARLDVFDHQVSVSPRGTVAAMFGHIGVALTADAYRQAQTNRDATPERATEVVARMDRRWAAARTSLSAYYIDRSRILVDGRATGVGMARGLELREQVRLGEWQLYGAVAYSQATRAVRPGAAEHPADLDVPLRIDALAQWIHGPWRAGARVQLRSGLPYTPVEGAVYDVDTDTYSALYGAPDSARTPWHRELDLRVDRMWRHLHAYLDVALDGGVLGYAYSYDYGKRLDVRALPVLPWVGIAGTL